MSMPKLPKELTDSRRLLENPYAYQNGEGRFDALGLPETVTAAAATTASALSESRRLLQDPYAYIGDIEVALAQQSRAAQETANSVDARGPHASIAARARDLQLRIWRKRHSVWPGKVPTDPVEMLDPAIAAGILGYAYEDVDYLGSEVAGVIDYPAKRIAVSRQFSPSVRRFTAAHELGHALLHREQRMHRDRPVDGSSSRREAKEIEADKFAAYFLMPEKLVRNYFQQVFGVIPFDLNEQTAFALNPSDPVGLIHRCRTPRDLSKLLAEAEYFNGNHVRSLADRFGVSVETMAIRIEELKLI